MLTGLAVEMSVVGICSMARLQRTLMSVMSWPCSLHQSAASLHAFLEKGKVIYMFSPFLKRFLARQGVHYVYPDGLDDKVSCYCQNIAKDDAIQSE